MIPSGIEPANFRFVAQHLNHCTTAVLQMKYYVRKLIEELPADKCNERNVLRNNTTNLLLDLQVNIVCANMLITPQINYFTCTYVEIAPIR